MISRTVESVEREESLAATLLVAARKIDPMESSDDEMGAGEWELVAIDALYAGIPVDSALEAQIRDVWLAHEPFDNTDQSLIYALETCNRV